MPVRLYGRYTGGGPAKVTVRGDLNGSDWQQSATIELPKRGPETPEIERMWAFHRMQGLLKQADRSGARDRVVDEIVRLGEAYSIAGEYTSFLVLENDAEYRRWTLDRQNALRIERDRSRQRELDAKLASIRRDVAESLGPTDGVRANANPGAAGQPGSASSRPAPFDQGGSTGGAGAVDPVTGGLALGIAALELVRRRRRDRKGR
jgi:hypothetical protein